MRIERQEMELVGCLRPCPSSNLLVVNFVRRDCGASDVTGCQSSESYNRPKKIQNEADHRIAVGDQR
jgi:hypothetical protein